MAPARAVTVVVARSVAVKVQLLAVVVPATGAREADEVVRFSKAIGVNVGWEEEEEDLLAVVVVLRALATAAVAVAAVVGALMVVAVVAAVLA